MTTIKLNDSDFIRESYPYLFEDESSSAIEVDKPYGPNATITVYTVAPEYVPALVRRDYERGANETGSAHLAKLAKQYYRWGGHEFDLTSKQASKLAKALKKAVKQAKATRV